MTDRRLEGRRFVVGAWALVAVVVNLAHRVGGAALIRRGGPLSELTTYRVGLFESQLWGDWGAYLNIAAHGYSPTSTYWFVVDPTGRDMVGFFPAYPLAVRALGWLSGVEAAAVLITMVSGLACALLLWRWMALKGVDERTRRLATWLALWYPWSFVLFGAGYGDAMALAFTIGAFLLLEMDRPVLAGLAGAVVTATRPSSIWIVLALVVVVAERRSVLTRTEGGRWRLERGSLRPADAGVLLSGVGIAAFMAWTWSRWGSPLVPLSNQTTYYAIGSDWWKVDFLRSLFSAPANKAERVNELASIVVMIAAALAAGASVDGSGGDMS